MSACATSNQKLAGGHNLAIVGPDVEITADHVDVRAGPPVGAGMRAVGITESHVNAGKFFILQNVADHAAQPDVGPDGEFADAIAVLVGMCVSPEFLFQLAVLRMSFHHAAPFNPPPAGVRP